MSFFRRFAYTDADKRDDNRRPSWKAFVIWLLCLMPAFLIFLNNNLIVPIRQEKKAVTGFVCESGGFSCTANIGPGWVGWAEVPQSDTVILENGKPLAFQDSYNVEIAKKGGGRYNVWGERAAFSSSDNSDPRTNNRLYEISGTVKYSSGVVWTFYSLAVIATLAFIVLYRKRLKFIAANPPFYIPALLLVVLFLITRQAFFIDYPWPGIWPDSAGYFAALNNFNSGQWPVFAIRPPLFSLFMKLVVTFVDRVMAVVALQNVLSLLGGMFWVYAVHRVRPSLSIPAAIAIAGWITGYGPLEHDTSLLSDSLYSTMIVFSFGLLFLGVYKKRPLVLALSSAAMAGAILTRPAGMFLVVIYLMVLAFLLWMRYPKKQIASFLIPFPALLLSLCLYNYLTVRVFAITAWGGANMAGTTLLYWEQDESYPASVNEGIARIQASVGQRVEDMKIMRTSSNQEELRRVFKSGFLGPEFSMAMNLDTGENGLGNQDKWLRRISLDAIKKHPDLYKKFVKTMLILYYESVGHDDGFNLSINNRAMIRFVDERSMTSSQKDVRAAFPAEFVNPVMPATVSVIGDGANAKIVFKPTGLWRIYRAFNIIRNFIFAGVIWSYALFIIFFISMAMLIRSRARNKGAFLIFTMSSAVIGASLIVSLVEYAEFRYTYPTEFIYYLALALAPLMFMKESGRDGEGK